MSESRVNSCARSGATADVWSLDRAPNLMRVFRQCLDGPSKFQVWADTGAVLKGTRWAGYGPQTELVGKCADLESAYKQCAVSPAHRSACVLGVVALGAEHGVEYYVANALPFGAVASVLGFNRAAHAIKSLIVRGLQVPCGHYFDDYPMVVPAEIATACDIAVKALGRSSVGGGRAATKIFHSARNSNCWARAWTSGASPLLGFLQ